MGGAECARSPHIWGQPGPCPARCVGPTTLLWVPPPPPRVPGLGAEAGRWSRVISSFPIYIYIYSGGASSRPRVFDVNPAVLLAERQIVTHGNGGGSWKEKVFQTQGQLAGGKVAGTRPWPVCLRGHLSLGGSQAGVGGQQGQASGAEAGAAGSPAGPGVGPPASALHGGTRPTSLTGALSGCPPSRWS